MDQITEDDIKQLNVSRDIYTRAMEILLPIDHLDVLVPYNVKNTPCEQFKTAGGVIEFICELMWFDRPHRSFLIGIQQLNDEYKFVYKDRDRKIRVYEQNIIDEYFLYYIKQKITKIFEKSMNVNECSAYFDSIWKCVKHYTSIDSEIIKRVKLRDNSDKNLIFMD